MRLRQRLQTADARGRDEGCGGRRRRISQRMSSSSSGPVAGERTWWWWWWRRRWLLIDLALELARLGSAVTLNRGK
jgi:hypothetical protein